MQSAQEVIDNLIHHRPAERVGLHEFLWPDTLQKWVQEGYPTNADGTPADPVDHFRYDMCPGGGGGDWFDILPLRGVSELVEESDEWTVKRNGAGAALKYWKHKSGTPEHIDFRMTSREIWERDYRPHLLEVDRARFTDLNKAKENLAKRKAQGYWTQYHHMFVWENMRQSMGDMTLYESMLLDPDWIHDYNRVYTDFFKAHYRLLFEEAGLPDGVWVHEDLGYKNGLFCSPKVFAELLFPYYKELNDFFHSYGLPVVLHSCGGVEEALPLIVEAEYDALHPMEVKAGCDVLRFADKYGDKLMFVGGLDVRILESGDRELIRRGVTNLVEGMKQRGASYVFGSDHSISTNVAYADYQYALEVCREHMTY